MNAERMQMIDKKISSMKQKEREAEREEQRMLQDANKRCKALSDRVNEIIQTANYLIDNDIQLPNRDDMMRFGYNHPSWADKFYHGVGFMTSSKTVHKPVECVGIISCGACGKWDFYMCGGDIFCKNWETGDKKAPDRFTLERFADMFPEFEAAFYAWVDDFCGR